MPIYTREYSSHPRQVLFFTGQLLSTLLDTIDTLGSSFFDMVFAFNIETKLNQRSTDDEIKKVVFLKK